MRQVLCRLSHRRYSDAPDSCNSGNLALAETGNWSAPTLSQERFEKVGFHEYYGLWFKLRSQRGTEEEFDRVADTFRDPRVWWIQKGEWWKENLWGGSSSYGYVHLNLEQQKKYFRV